MINETGKCTAATGAVLANLSKNQDRVSVGHSDINKQVIYSNYLLNTWGYRKSQITLSHNGEIYISIRIYTPTVTCKCKWNKFSRYSCTNYTSFMPTPRCCDNNVPWRNVNEHTHVIVFDTPVRNISRRWRVARQLRHLRNWQLVFQQRFIDSPYSSPSRPGRGMPTISTSAQERRNGPFAAPRIWVTLTQDSLILGSSRTPATRYNPVRKRDASEALAYV